MEKEVSERSTKKELWEAYQTVLQAKDLAVSNVVNIDVDDLNTTLSNVKKSSHDKRAALSVETTLRVFEDVQKIVVDMAKRFQGDFEVLEKRMREDEEELNMAITRKREEWKREQEEYLYRIKLERRKDEDEYTRRVQERERQMTEKYATKEKELTEREDEVKIREQEMKQLQSEVALFPGKLEKAIREAEQKTRSEGERDAKTAAALIAKDIEREQEVAKLKVQNLEDVIKLRSAHIMAIEKQLAQANEQIQKLAVTVVESGSNAFSKRNFQEQERQESKQTSNPIS